MKKFLIILIIFIVVVSIGRNIFAYSTFTYEQIQNGLSDDDYITIYNESVEFAKSNSQLSQYDFEVYHYLIYPLNDRIEIFLLCDENEVYNLDYDSNSNYIRQFLIYHYIYISLPVSRSFELRGQSIESGAINCIEFINYINQGGSNYCMDFDVIGNGQVLIGNHTLDLTEPDDNNGNVTNENIIQDISTTTSNIYDLAVLINKVITALVIFIIAYFMYKYLRGIVRK